MDEVERVTGVVFVESDAFLANPTDIDEAREAFIENNKLTKAQAETVTLDDTRHDVGHGFTYTFSADAK